VARERLAGWRLTLLLSTVPLERAIGLAFTESLRTNNGGLTVRAVHAHVQARGAVDGPAGAP
jgi:hypothetical protein